MRDQVARTFDRQGMFMILPIARFCLPTVILLLASSCGTLRIYPGNPRPQTSVAVFKYPPSRTRTFVVENVWIDSTFLWDRWRGGRDAEILPGIHIFGYVRRDHRHPDMRYAGTFRLQALAGHTYTLQFMPSTEPSTGGLVGVAVDITDPNHKFVVPVIAPPTDKKTVQPDRRASHPGLQQKRDSEP
jgi:hypothetical protein